ncbi:MAG: hypothetical protein WAT23_18135 [Chromatiaceae bacterium]
MKALLLKAPLILAHDNDYGWWEDEEKLRIPNMTVATDSMIGIGVAGKFLPWDADYSKFADNPRTPGAMAKTLCLVREQGVPLMLTLAQLSYWSALHLGDTGLQDMRDRGRVQVGKPIRFPVETIHLDDIGAVEVLGDKK